MSAYKSNLHFKAMAFTLRLRDLFLPPKKNLCEAGVKPGDTVLDYGCGVGSYSLPAARLVGGAGKVYAADLHPLATGKVEKAAARKGLGNLVTIRTDCATGLAEESVDVILLYDALHEIAAPEPLLSELHRVLKPGGVLSVSDHHMKEEAMVARVSGTGLFRLAGRPGRTYKFARVQQRLDGDSSGAGCGEGDT